MGLMLAGLDKRDVVSGRNPDLGLAALGQRKPQTWQQVLGGVAHQSGADTGGDAEWDAARRLRTASLTPDGREQPPEVLGVDASARVPNSAQPMPGEFENGREVGSGRPGFFGRLMPPPTGVANGVGVPEGHVFGAPTGMPATDTSTALAALPATGGDRVPVGTLAALPHFAGGGILPPGGTGVVGEQGEETIQALPLGGVTVTPMAPTGPVVLAASPRAATPQEQRQRTTPGSPAGVQAGETRFAERPGKQVLQPGIIAIRALRPTPARQH